MKAKKYWCDIVKTTGFLYIAIPVACILMILSVLLVNAISDSTIQKKIIKETETCETYYDTYYTIKYEQLVDVVNRTLLPGGTLNLRMLDTNKYSIVKEKDSVVYTCEFTENNKKKEETYIITTILSPNYEVLSQETNQVSRAVYTNQHLAENVYRPQAIGKFFGYCFVFGLFYVGFFASVIYSKKRKNQDLEANDGSIAPSQKHH